MLRKNEPPKWHGMPTVTQSANGKYFQCKQAANNMEQCSAAAIPHVVCTAMLALVNTLFE